MIMEQKLREFLTYDIQSCFEQCKSDPLCVGQNIFQLPENVYKCELITMGKGITSRLAAHQQALVSNV